MERPIRLRRDRPLDHNGKDPAGPAPACAREHPGPRSADIALDDWDVLFGAVRARLLAAAGTPPRADAPADAERASARLRTVVLECLDALGQLHQTMVQEVDRRPRLDRDAAGIESTGPVRLQP